MKKFWLIVFLIPVILSSVGCTPRGSINLEEKAVDNAYNNVIAGGDLVRVDDALYYAYERNTNQWGLFRIDKKGSERVFWDGPLLKPLELVGSLRAQEDSIYLSTAYRIWRYDITTAEVDKGNTSCLPDSSLAAPIYAETEYGIVANVATEGYGLLSGRQLIVKKPNGVETVVVSGADDAYCGGFGIDNNCIIYILRGRDSTTCMQLRRYSLSDGTDSLLLDFRDSGIFECSGLGVFVEKGKAFFVANYREQEGYHVCLIDYAQQNPHLETVSFFTNYPSLNLYNGTLYIVGDNGVQTYNIDTGETHVLTNRAAKACYILDEVWVYYTDSKANLYRVRQDGGVVEEVFVH